MAILRTLKGLNPGQVFPIEGQSAVMGRNPDCDIVLDEGAVSRQHARITNIDGQFYVEDQGSRNGTFLNGELVTGRQLLEENDQLRVCDLVFVFHRGPGVAGLGAEADADDSSDTMGPGGGAENMSPWCWSTKIRARPVALR